MYERENIERSIYLGDVSWSDSNYVYVIARDSKDQNHYCKKLWRVMKNIDWIRLD